MTVCLTGYRPKKLPWGFDEGSKQAIEFKERIKQHILQLHERGYREFLNGMAQGFDMYCADVILELNKTLDWKIRLVCIIPCPEQCEKWSIKDKKRYEEILKQADEYYYTSLKYDSSCMHIRNRDMVNSADIVFACYDGQSGGTKNTIQYALKKGLRVESINPNSLNIEVL